MFTLYAAAALLYYTAFVTSSPDVSNSTASLVFDNVEQIDDELTEVQEQMSRKDKDISDFEESLRTLDLEPDERSEIEEYLDQLIGEWKELKSKAGALRSKRCRWMQFVMVPQNISTIITVPTQDTVAKIAAWLAEVDGQMNKTEKQIVDLEKTLGTIDLEPGERTRLEDDLDRFRNKWKELETEPAALSTHRHGWVQFVMVPQNGTRFPELSQ